MAKHNRKQHEENRRKSREEFGKSAGGNVNADNVRYVKEAINFCLGLPDVGRKGLIEAFKDEISSKRITQIASGCFPACPKREAPVIIKFARSKGFGLTAD